MYPVGCSSGSTVVGYNCCCLKFPRTHSRCGRPLVTLGVFSLVVKSVTCSYNYDKVIVFSKKEEKVRVVQQKNIERRNQIPMYMLQTHLQVLHVTQPPCRCARAYFQGI